VRTVRLWLARFRGILHRDDDAALDAEIRQHLDLLARRYQSQGLTPDEAAAAARRQFGNTTQLKEDRRSLRTSPAFESLWSDVRQAARVLRHQRGFTAAVAATLALGIGANTAVFSLCNTLLLKPLPYSDPDRLVMLWEQADQGGPLLSVAPANFVDWRERIHSFTGIAAINPFPSFVLTGSGVPARLAVAAVSSNFFSVLGKPVALGRSFQPEEDRPGGNRVAILSHPTWTSRFGGRPDIVGQTITLNDLSFTVVGVLPADFEFVGRDADFQAKTRFDIWIPLALNARPSRGSHPLRVFARMKTNTTIEQAQAELDVVGADLSREFPDDNQGKGIQAISLHQQVAAPVRPALLTLLAAVGFVLLIACGNVANLLLSRGAARHREFAVRLALGAGRGRIARQLLLESTMLGVLGGALGLAVALAAVRLAAPYLPPDMARAADLSLDWRVLLFTAAASLGTGVLFGLAPLAQAHGARPVDSMLHGTRLVGDAHGRLRGALAVGQLAVTLMLLVGAALLVKSLWTLLHVPPGFQAERVLTARVTLPRPRYTDIGRMADVGQQVLERLRRSPGVEAAGMAAYLPLSGDDNGWAFVIEGRPPLPTGRFNLGSSYRPVSDGYFETTGMPLIRGRSFDAADRHGAPLVVVINQSMARTYWGTQDPVGERLRFVDGPEWRTIVGVVGDVRHAGLDGDVRPELYVPFGQAPAPEATPAIVVRSSVDAATLTSAIRSAVAAADPSLPLDRIVTMDELVASSVGQPRFRTILLAALALLALAIATVGVFSVTNYSVARRTREFGVYLAMGATPGDLVRRVLGETATLVGLGLALGCAGSVALARLLAGFLFGVTALDPQTFILVPLALGAIGLLAGYVPARRATRIEPMAALRYE
jgi:putative ABC transport system permease protein